MAEQEKVPCVVRSPTRDEMPQVVDMINAKGWNTHLEILLDIFDLQPDSSKVAVDENGLILCHCCFVSLDESNALATGFITRSGHRGKGIGKLVWEACKKQIEGKNLFVTSIVSMVSWYEKQGAKLSSPPAEMCEIFVLLKKQFDDQFLKEINNNSYEIKTYMPSMFNEVDKYDATFHCIKRTHFLRVHLEKCHCIKVACDDTGSICGYGTIRQSNDGYSLMPLYGENTTIAKKILHSLVLNIPDGTKLKIVICDENADGAEEVLKHIGYQKQPYDPGHHGKRLFTVVDSPVTSGRRVYSTMNFQYSLV